MTVIPLLPGSHHPSRHVSIYICLCVDYRNAIFSMGVVGSGTNNARLAGMLRNLAQFYHKEPSDLFVVRLAQVRVANVIVTIIYGPF